MEKAKSIAKKVFGHLLFIIIFGIFGYFLGMFIGKYADSPIYILVWLAVAFIVYFSQLILHEAGHYLFGRLSGYSFVSFRIGNYTWIKEHGKLVLKKFKIPGTGGQCLMMPPEEDENGDIYALYHMGGVLVNLIFAIAGVLIYVIGSNVNVKAFGFILAGISGISVLTNGIPLKINGVANDGYNLFLLKKDKTARRSAHIMLKTNGLRSLGVRMKEMPYTWFVLPEDVDLSNTMHATIRIMEGNWFYDNMQFEEARICYETLLNQSEKLLDIHKLELECEILFIELIGQQREEIIKEFYTKKLKKYMKTMAVFDINKKKLQYVLCLYEKGDNWEEKLEKIYEEAIKLKDTYPIKAEVEAEMEVFDFLRAPKQILKELEQN